EVARIGRQTQARLLADRGVERLERGAPLAERRGDEALSGAVGEYVEGDEARRRLARQLLDAALRRMEAHLQAVERQGIALRHDELAVENELPRREGGQARGHFR